MQSFQYQARYRAGYYLVCRYKVRTR
uniref:Uncharacterized protein n=1 Tax=Anguilla anguilla TaxID=7936 RepID=A0A0E9TGG9_ANGAN